MAISIYQKIQGALSGIITAISAQKKKLRSPLGDILLQEKIISPHQLQQALMFQLGSNLKLGQIIVSQGYAKEEEVLNAMEIYYGISLDSLESTAELFKPPSDDLWKRISGLRVPIKIKLSGAIIFIIWLTILILSFTILARQKEQLYAQTVKLGKVSLNYFTNDAKMPLLDDDIVLLNTVIKEAATVEGLLYAIIIDTEQIIKAHTDYTKIGMPMPAFDPNRKRTQEGDITFFPDTLPDGKNVLNLSRPITFHNKNIGAVHVGISIDFIQEQIRQESIFILIMSVLIVILGIVIATILGIYFSFPISQLVLATKEIGKGNFQHKTNIARKDEFGDLADAFNYMSQELWKKLLMQKSFGRYVSPDVLDLILSNPEESWLKGARSEATVLFADVRGFTAYSETREPEAIVEDLNEYFGIITRHILEHGGYVDKFIGDAVMGVFCLPISQNDHAERAVRAAIAMQRELQQGAGSKNVLLTKIGIGINSGMLVSGNLGSDIKMEYTVIGDNVNIAARVLAVAESGKIIITDHTFKLTQHLITVAPLPPQRVKGKSEPLGVFEVLGLKG
ncbi:MAG: HAMP domain-containing protein [Deltaproteobacteria bacterium]|nr:HAMP domain-containing protein [Deltaproteobacteria bacterium]